MTRRRIGERALTKAEKVKRQRVRDRKCRTLAKDLSSGAIATIEEAKARADEALSPDSLPGPGEREGET